MPNAMMPSTFKGAVLFDLDGTLIDTVHDFAETINEIRTSCHLEQLAINDIRPHISNGAKAMIQCAYPDDSLLDRDQQTQQLLALCEKNLGRHAQVFSGIHGILDMLAANQIAWAIITNRNARFTTPLLKKLHLKPTRNTVICPEQVKHPKPDPEGILLAIKALGVAPSTCIYVGDHVRDIEAARHAHIRSIACEYGYIEAHENIRNWHADYIVTDTNALQALLQSLFQVN